MAISSLYNLKTDNLPCFTRIKLGDIYDLAAVVRVCHALTCSRCFKPQSRSSVFIYHFLSSTECTGLQPDLGRK